MRVLNDSLGKQSKQQWGSPGRLACLLPGEHGCGEGRMFNKNSFRPGILTPGKEKPSVPSKTEWKRGERSEGPLVRVPGVIQSPGCVAGARDLLQENCDCSIKGFSPGLQQEGLLKRRRPPQGSRDPGGLCIGLEQSRSAMLRLDIHVLDPPRQDEEEEPSARAMSPTECFCLLETNFPTEQQDSVKVATSLRKRSCAACSCGRFFSFQYSVA
ncbi:hypothetical protein EYF80_023842 [Liparis tanakae]|uniref:Uncharacterized protein n=1 Tax=Liparis tanakae TaxID=230148 RepID=A0A4Z2HJ82_9TELE|nr:hypothetical protein EYF80_023842 [Liparis tanakae]